MLPQFPRNDWPAPMRFWRAGWRTNCIPMPSMPWRGAGRRSRVKAFGAATPETLFDLASLTKPMATATCLMQLVEQGRLHLRQSVHRFFEDEFGPLPHLSGVEVRHLLTHTSGLPPIPRWPDGRREAVTPRHAAGRPDDADAAARRGRLHLLGHGLHSAGRDRRPRRRAAAGRVFAAGRRRAAGTDRRWAFCPQAAARSRRRGRSRRGRSMTRAPGTWAASPAMPGCSGRRGTCWPMPRPSAPAAGRFFPAPPSGAWRRARFRPPSAPVLRLVLRGQ